MKPQVNQFRVFCSVCSFNSVVTEDQIGKFTEINQTIIQRNLDKLEDNKLVPHKKIKRMRKFKCPKCGKGIFTPKPIKETETENDENQNNIT